MSQTRLKEILLLLASLAITVVLAEFVARMFDVRPYETRLERYEFDETLGWKTRISYATYISKLRYAHHLHYNKDGFPSSKADVNNAASREKPSIALIGDSFIEGYYLPHEQTLAYQVSQSTDKQVLNLGVSGYSPGQYLLSARKHLADYNVTDIIVFLFAFNDIPYVSLDMYRGYAKPLVSDDTFAAVNLPLEKKAGNENETRGFARDILDKFALWSLAKPLFSFMSSNEGVVLETEKLAPDEMARSLKLIARINTEFPDATFHIYYIPDITELKEDEILRFNTGSFKKYCSQMELNCIYPDLFADYDVDTLYIEGDHHFSELGARLVADQISEILKQ